MPIHEPSEVLLAVIESAKSGHSIPPEEALPLVASLINRLDKYSDSYPKDMQDLVSIGACIWQMQSE